MAASKSRAKPRPEKSAKAESSGKQISSFLAKYTPQMATTASDARARMRKRIPGGVEFVYDNYNALVFGFGPNDRPSDAVLSLAVFPEWVTLCFLQGARLSDPKKLLKGSGNIVRNIRLSSPAHLDDPDLEKLVAAAIAAATPAFPSGAVEPQTIVKSISAKQRPRRPGEPGARKSR
ncbi:MAG TPA: DUF1801 domain-containing protein [Gemmatimonadaceae bacterium]|nr:DUF1801 domain-containing protein [Gemmatimonadaceae bacterium]